MTTPQATQAHKPDGIGLTRNAQKEVTALLNKVLADEYVLYTKTRGFHWNVTGPNFRAFHRLFEEQYQELNTVIDDVAERVRALQGLAHGGVKAMLQDSEIADAEQDVPWREMVQRLLDDHETVARTLRRGIRTCDELDDQGTMDFLTGLLEKHEKTSWMLRSHLDD